MKRDIFRWFVILFAGVAAVSCSEDPAPAPPQEEDNLVEATLASTRTASELQGLIRFSGRDIDVSLIEYDVDVYKVTYRTTYNGDMINASGLVALPKTSNPVGMLSFQRGTIVKQADAPSVLSQGSVDVISYAALASMGFVTGVPDLIGFGASQQIIHPYYVEEPTAVAVVDLIRASRTLAAEKNIPANGKLFLAGYSQGGYATMAAHKALEEEPLEALDLIASFPAAGGYDVKAVQEYFFSLETYPHPYYLAYVGLAYESFYGQAQLLGDFFQDPYASRIPALFDGFRSAGDINAQLTSRIPDLVRQDILTGINTEPRYEYLNEMFAENSLTDWVPQRSMFLYHGDADTTVPYENSALTVEKLRANGASEGNLQFIRLAGKDHSTGVEPYIEDVVIKLQALK